MEYFVIKVFVYFMSLCVIGRLIGVLWGFANKIEWKSARFFIGYGFILQ